MKTYAQRLLELEKNYKPASTFFTSKLEAEQVEKTLGLNELNDFELQNMRDMTVMFFGSRADDNDMDAWNKMMSITAVIDHIKWDRGLAV